MGFRVPSSGDRDGNSKWLLEGFFLRAFSVFLCFLGVFRVLKGALGAEGFGGSDRPCATERGGGTIAITWFGV